MACDGCAIGYLEAIQRFYNHNDTCIEAFRNHGVLRREVECGNCGTPCVYSKEKKQWRCYKIEKKNKKRAKSFCGFTIMDRKGSFLEGTHLEEWQILLYVLFFLEKTFRVVNVQKHLKISSRTAVDWNSFCCEVTLQWFQNQEAIGGKDVEVEIDETAIARRKYERGRVLKTVWVFGGIERNRKKNSSYHSHRRKGPKQTTLIEQLRTCCHLSKST